jgi:cytochrome oxidase Cu insertion factor (SCO1/SenC/PrrC family)
MKRAAALAMAAALLLGCGKKEDAAPASRAGDAAVRPAEPRPVGVLGAGTPAPDFSAPAHDGTTIKLSDLRGKVVVLYFYPKDETPG